jgi:hypothetical protein
MKSLPVYIILLILVSLSMMGWTGFQFVSGQQSESLPNSESLPQDYSSSEYGVEITFPKGWNRLHIPGNGSVVEVATSSKIDERSISELVKSPSIFLIINKQDSAVAMSPPLVNNVDCSTIFRNYELVHGIPAMESTIHCKMETSSINIKSITMNTGTRWIVLMYSSPSSRFDDYVASFEDSLGTLTIKDPNLWFLTIEGANIPITINSSSIVTDVGVDAQNKRIFFSTEGGISSNVVTTISIGRILQGPYAVTVDQNTNSKFRTIEGTSDTDTSLEISHPPGAHTIEIVGTNVIPEFPVSFLILFAIVLIALFSTRSFELLKTRWKMN